MGRNHFFFKKLKNSDEGEDIKVVTLEKEGWDHGGVLPESDRICGSLGRLVGRGRHRSCILYVDFCLCIVHAYP